MRSRAYSFLHSRRPHYTTCPTNIFAVQHVVTFNPYTAGDKDGFVDSIFFPSHHHVQSKHSPSWMCVCYVLHTSQTVSSRTWSITGYHASANIHDVHLRKVVAFRTRYTYHLVLAYTDHVQQERRPFINTRFKHVPFYQARSWRTLFRLRSRRHKPDVVTPFHYSHLAWMQCMMTANECSTHVPFTSFSWSHRGRIRTSHIASCTRTLVTSRHTSSQFSLCTGFINVLPLMPSRPSLRVPFVTTGTG